MGCPVKEIKSSLNQKGQKKKQMSEIKQHGDISHPINCADGQAVKATSEKDLQITLQGHVKNHNMRTSADKNESHDHCQRRNPKKGLPGHSDFERSEAETSEAFQKPRDYKIILQANCWEN